MIFIDIYDVNGVLFYGTVFHISCSDTRHASIIAGVFGDGRMFAELF